jgi:hypothetical protein
MRVRQRNHQNFVFASAAGYLGAANPNTVYLDGQIAYNIGQNGTRRPWHEGRGARPAVGHVEQPCG